MEVARPPEGYRRRDGSALLRGDKHALHHQRTSVLPLLSGTCLGHHQWESQEDCGDTNEELRGVAGVQAMNSIAFATVSTKS